MYSSDVGSSNKITISWTKPDTTVWEKKFAFVPKRVNSTWVWGSSYYTRTNYAYVGTHYTDMNIYKRYTESGTIFDVLKDSNDN